MNKMGLLVTVAILAIFILVAFLMATADPVGTAILQAQGSIAVAPITVSPVGGLWDLAAQVLIGVTAGVACLGLVLFVYGRIKALAQPQRIWKGGPGANFARIQPVKPPSLMDLLMFNIAQQMGLSNRQQPAQPAMPEDRRKAEL